MFKRSRALVLFLLVCFSPGAAFSQICAQSEMQACFCPDGTTGSQSCRADGGGWNQCECTYYSIWNDEATGLQWQNPQKDAYNYDDIGLTQPDALRYCAELVYGGYDDWRLPTVDELRSLIRGNPPTETGGECPITEGSLRDDMYDLTCRENTEFAGPGPSGCYWPAELDGTCDKQDPAAAGHPLEYCASTVAADNAEWVGSILFDNGAVAFNHLLSYAEVRCVRSEQIPPVTCDVEVSSTPEPCTPGITRQCTTAEGNSGVRTCASDGSCFGLCDYTGFVPGVGEDVSEQCDQVQLTITIPENMPAPPKVLMAFLYEVTDWTFPPMRPPDGGTDYNQVIDPAISADAPYVMTVPGCTYYRDRCLVGDYYLYVALMQNDQMPPTMQAGDYWWGMEQVPIPLGSDPAEVIAMEIELVPYEDAPTLIELSSLSARPGNGSVVLSWSTAAEIDNAGFNIYRAERPDDDYIKVNGSLIAAAGSATGGASYEYSDRTVTNGTHYYYKLEDIDLHGAATQHEPVPATPRLMFGLLGR